MAALNITVASVPPRIYVFVLTDANARTGKNSEEGGKADRKVLVHMTETFSPKAANYCWFSQKTTSSFFCTFVLQPQKWRARLKTDSALSLPHSFFFLVRPVHMDVIVDASPSCIFIFSLTACNGKCSIFSGSCNRRSGGAFVETLKGGRVPKKFQGQLTSGA